MTANDADRSGTWATVAVLDAKQRSGEQPPDVRRCKAGLTAT
jgi:hypothetical protein